MHTEMTDLLPEVLPNLAQHNKVEDIKRFMKLVAEGNFPMEIIAYQLFNDMVNWFSSGSSKLMQYSSVSLQFWRTGHHLLKTIL